MQLCKTCRALMIGQDASRSIPRLKRLLRTHGANPETLVAVAESLGPICDKCLRNMDQTLRAG